MSVPVKYREIGDFHEYYSGGRTAPYLTVFVGGNHEASNYLWELYYGGWVAPNIYYLGAANVIRLGPIRIAAMSGIWKGFDYKKPHHERLPYNQDDVKSIYHVREIDVRKLLQIRTQVDIGISHDWPRAVEWGGDHQRLFRQKDLFEAESRAGTLGSAAAKYVLDRLRPAYWFAAHLHVKFSAVVNHDGEAGPAYATKAVPVKVGVEMGDNAAAGAVNSSIATNADEIDLDMGDMDDGANITQESSAIPENEGSYDREAMTVPESLREQLPASFAPPVQRPPRAVSPPPVGITNKNTRFLALDKCLPNRNFLQLLEVDGLSNKSQQTEETARPLRLEYDPEWLAITRALSSELVLGDRQAVNPPNKGSEAYLPLIQEAEQWVEQNIVAHDRLIIPDNFSITAPIYDEKQRPRDPGMPVEHNDPQTIAFCELVGIENKFFATDEERAARQAQGPAPERPRYNQGGGRGGRGGRGGGRRGRGRGRW